jgi:hypothetical protein
VAKVQTLPCGGGGVAPPGAGPRTFECEALLASRSTAPDAPKRCNPRAKVSVGLHRRGATQTRAPVHRLECSRPRPVPDTAHRRAAAATAALEGAFSSVDPQRGPGRGPGAWTRSVDPERGPGAWTRSVDPGRGPGAWTRGVDPGRGPGAWTRGVDPGVDPGKARSDIAGPGNLGELAWSRPSPPRPRPMHPLGLCRSRPFRARPHRLGPPAVGLPGRL